MKNVKVTAVSSDDIVFNDGTHLFSEHEQDCCENHWLSMEHLSLFDFEGLEFDLTTDTFFNRIDDYGIELVPIHGHSVKIPGYGSNNGYYSTNLSLVIENKALKIHKAYDVSNCQIIND